VAGSPSAALAASVSSAKFSPLKVGFMASNHATHGTALGRFRSWESTRPHRDTFAASRSKASFAPSNHALSDGRDEAAVHR
jgi:hypothetical protein